MGGEKAAWVSGQGGGGEPGTFHFPWSRSLAVGMAGEDGLLVSSLAMGMAGEDGLLVSRACR